MGVSNLKFQSFGKMHGFDITKNYVGYYVFAIEGGEWL